MGVVQPLLAEVMDKMPSLESEWFWAVMTGVIAFAAARILPFGWLVGLVLVFYQLQSDWFVDPVATYAQQEDPRASRIAQLAVVFPILATVIGAVLRYLARKSCVAPTT
jgi:hypothetical protein